jgi:hypothetical protein
MDFKVTGWIERNYKWLVGIIVIFITTYGLYYYFSIEDKSDTFIVSSFYALVLFVAGIYINYMSSKITDRLEERIEIYLNLKRVQSLFKTLKKEEIEDYEAIKSNIIWFKGFTGRTEKDEGYGTTPYIKEHGIKFNSNELEIEDRYLELYSALEKSIVTIVENYIRNNNINISCRNVVINGIYSFNPESWCKEHLSNFSTDGKKMVNYVYDKLNNLRNEYLKLELLGTKISKLYFKYLIRAKNNINQIEKMYGRRLQYIISQKSEIQNNFDYLFKSLNEMKDSIELQIEEHDAKIEQYVECFDQVNDSIENLCVDVNEIKEIVSGLDVQN